MTKITLLTLILHTTSLWALACDGILPPNKLYIPISNESEGLSKLQYDAVIDKVEKIYAPIVTGHEGVLVVNRDWPNGTVNAGTTRSGQGVYWNLNLYGGLARHRYMTEDAYALVICHELGHHIGGAPKKVISDSPDWSSTEGQADYWATLKCLRTVFQDDENHLEIREETVPPIVFKECKNSFPVKKESALCIRLAMAGKALSKISAVARRTDFPIFETPDPEIVRQIYEKHPLPQCRLDSYFQGALCPLALTSTVSQEDEMQGTCHPQNGDQTGMRPLCWYRP
jgi:hypothetical protein